ncbi:tyrosine-type recombinase/integrase [Bacillus sp. REN16]|uniref:tyrosine-type recombinase/integrase n=1 Tax=Bacillus sp. REN16 TaxID=2887296 RepID=UPI001E38D76C|nr:tyrosine-type recombinase/integrase [Bacillus sp. REN16]MCC3357915.1 tyrosine-type recombinase/integrase [Bacillus sp. REN16]
MEFVDPIRDVNKINEIKDVLKKQSQRDLLLFVFGINTGIKVSDLLYLRVKDVWDESGMKEFLYVKDTTSGEVNAFYLNNMIKKELSEYLQTIEYEYSDFLFKSKKDNQPISRQQAYRIINHAAREVGIPGKIGMHTLRKTFGYHAYLKGIAISILMDIYNHHSPSETFKYIGINKEEKSLVKVDVNL